MINSAICFDIHANMTYYRLTAIKYNLLRTLLENMLLVHST